MNIPSNPKDRGERLQTKEKKVFVKPKLSYKTPKLQEQGHVNVVVQFGEFTNFS